MANTDTERFSKTEGPHGEPYKVKHVVTAAEDTAGTLSVATPFAIIDDYMITARNSSGEMLASQFGTSVSGGTITIADGSTNPASGDIISVAVWGRGGR